MALDPTSVVQAVETVISRHSCPHYVKERALTCFAKLSDRFADKGDPAALSLLEKLIKKHETSHSLELQLRACEYDALVSATKGIKMKVTKPPSAEPDLFGVTEPTNGGEAVSQTVITAAKEALSRMPVVDLKVLEKKREEAFGDIRVPTAKPSVAAPQSSGDLLDLNDMFGGGAPAPAQNGGSSAVAPKSDLDLLTDIFSAPAPAVGSAPALPVGGSSYDPFGAPPPVLSGGPAAVNPLDIFGASLPSTSAPTPVPVPSNPLDIFGATPVPAAVPSGVPSAAPMMMGGPPAISSAPVAAAGSVVVPGFSHEGLTIQFECSKPDAWNKQSSVLIAKCINSAPDALYGFNLQCAVPKYVTMELEPPTSTTIPVTGPNASRFVTQKIKVSNSQLGTKNLMLKLKVSFTVQGRKIEHLATCSGFPPGEY
jgi:AP-1 complex subunit gamma-1